MVKDVKEEIKGIVKEEVESAEVSPDITDDTIGVDIETEHTKVELDVDKDGTVDVSVNNRKFSIDIKGLSKIMDLFYLPDGKVNKDRIGAVTFGIMFALTQIGIL